MMNGNVEQNIGLRPHFSRGVSVGNFYAFRGQNDKRQ